MTDGLIGLGSNLGDRLTHLRTAVHHLSIVLSNLEISNVYETLPVGYTEQEPFFNAALRGLTDVGSQRLFFWAKTLEFAGGRRPGPRYGPRPLDVDIIAFGNLELSSDRVQIPHPAYAHRAFVLAPLADIAPDVVIPSASDTIRVLDTRAGRVGVSYAYPPSTIGNSTVIKNAG